MLHRELLLRCLNQDSRDLLIDRMAGDGEEEDARQTPDL